MKVLVLDFIVDKLTNFLFRWVPFIELVHQVFLSCFFGFQVACVFFFFNGVYAAVISPPMCHMSAAMRDLILERVFFYLVLHGG